jgi:hypothetical protein
MVWCDCSLCLMSFYDGKRILPTEFFQLLSERIKRTEHFSWLRNMDALVLMLQEVNPALHQKRAK